MLTQETMTAPAPVAIQPSIAAILPSQAVGIEGTVLQPQHDGPLAKKFISPDFLPQDIAEVRTTALRVCAALMEGKGLGMVAAGNTDIDGFGIVHMLFNIWKKGLFLTDMAPSKILDTLFLEQDIPSDTFPRSRHKFIAALKRNGLVPDHLSDKDLKPAGTNPSHRDVCLHVQELTRITVEEIASPSRSRNVVDARFQSIWVLRQVCGLSLSMIGRHMGGRDHTTILNSVNKMASLIRGDQEKRDAMELLCENCDRIGVARNRQILVTHMAA